MFLTTAATAQVPLEYAPYEIDVFIAANDPGDMSDVANSALHKQLTNLASAHVGAAWTLTAHSPDGALHGELITRFDNISPERLIELTPPSESRDKAMYVRIRHDTSGWTVDARELDLRTYHLSPVIQRDNIRRSHLAEEILDALVAAFSPVAELGAAEGGVIEGKLQAALLVVDPDSPVLVAAGDPWTPIVRRNDRLGRASPNDVVVLPWTVLETVKLDGAKLSCQIHTAHQNPLGGKSRLRLKRYAQATRYPDRETRLQLQTPGDVPSPLIGYEIVQREVTNGEVRVIGRTNDTGGMTLAPTDDRWRTLYVRHGDRLLARLPMVAGWDDAYTVPLPSDDIRLAAEGFLSAFRQEIVDTVARRQILSTRIRRRIAEGQFDEAELLVSQFRKLTGAREFAQRLDSARGELVADNARAQQLIDQMFSDTRQVLDRYLDPTQADALASQLARARAEG